MPMRDLTLMVMPDGRVWIDADSMVDYLRSVEQQGIGEATRACNRGEALQYAGAMAVQDIVRQIADSLVVNGMAAREEIAGRRVPR